MYSIYSPVQLTYTGMLNTAGAPVDVATFPLPVTGARWIFSSPVLAHLYGTGDIGGAVATYAGYTLPAGGGPQVINVTTASACTPGMARVGAYTVTGWIQASGITLRATSNVPFTGIAEVTIQAWPLI